jgi:hypothetical protein
MRPGVEDPSLSGDLRIRLSQFSLLCATALFLLFLALPALLQAGTEDGLIGYWKCDEGQGLALSDQTQLNGTGVLLGNVSWTTGHLGNALGFDGSTGYVKVTTSPALANLSVFSLSVWVKMSGDGSTFQEILERGSAYFTRGSISLYYVPFSRRFQFSFYELDATSKLHFRYANSPVLWTPGQWHHIAVRSDGKTVTVFLDGRPGIPVTVYSVDPLEDGNGNTHFSRAMYIGALIDKSDSPVNFLNGSIDEIRIYNRALTFDDIIELYGSTPPPLTFATSLATTRWPHLYGLVGPYAVTTAQDVTDLVSAGFDLVLTGYYPTSSIGQALTANGVKQIVPITGKLYQLCPANQDSCVLSASEEQAVLDYARNIISASANDSLVVGYWIIDDSPGDVSAIVQKFHDLIAEANETSVFPRPAICGLAGSLDRKLSADDSNFVYGGVAFDAFINISPTACDMIGLYLYGQATSDDPNLVDWSMQYMLPQILDGLRVKGWDQSLQPLLALPHTFGMQTSSGSFYVLPRASDVATQIESYCRAGAITLLPYTWHTSSSGSTYALWNTPSLVTGLQQGMNICQTKYWNLGSSGCTNSLVRINNVEPGYLTLDATFDAINANGTITMQEHTFTEDNLTYRKSYAVTLRGGYNCGFTFNDSNYSTITGKVTVGGLGRVAFDQVIIR